MEHRRDSRQELFGDPFTVPSFSIDSSPTVVGSPASPLHHRPGYQRISSLGEVDTQYHGSDWPRLEEADVGETMSGRGLAIESFGHQRVSSIPRVPVGSKGSPITSGSADLLLSPPSNWKDFREDIVDDRESQYHGSDPSAKHETFIADADTERLTSRTRVSTMGSHAPPGSEAPLHCTSNQNIYQGRGNWLAVTILILAIYSTVFSCIWVLMAIIRPRYGHRITSTGSLPPGTASLITALFAKSIELSFVSVFVAFLGQVLSRRALVKKSKGITIAEMSMRSWIMQPGTMITHWESVRYAGGTFLGVIALTAALLSSTYTSASDALVSPKLRFGNTESRLIYGRVATSFANPFYIQDHCQTPIIKATDPEHFGQTCIQIEHAGQAYHNYMQYLATWTDNIGSGNGSVDLNTRPPPTGMLYDNTTVQGSWIDVQNMTDVSNKYGRRVNNVSMAMPHGGVFQAVRDPINNIMQPQDLSGLGEYYVEASVPSPKINVLCASVTEDEIAPLVYSKWPDADPLNASLWPNEYDLPTTPSWLNATAVDDLFGFGEKYDRRPPVFPKIPLPYNTVLNASYVADAIYLLATSPNSDLLMCSLSASLTPQCSTTYHASMSGGSLNSRCDAANSLAYGKSQPKATSGIRSTDWINVASEWAMSISLGAGISDGQASNARLLTQLIPTSNALNPSLPSIAEALAVLAGCTLLISSQDSPFIHYWNYSSTVVTLKIPQLQGFNATLRSQDYASGGVQRWQGIFYIPLVLVFVTNVFCLVYFIIRGGLVTDFIEPQNLFALSVNSPPSQSLAGSCGGGPEKEQFRATWYINLDGEHVFIENGDEPPIRMRKVSKPISDFERMDSPIASTYKRLSKKSSSLL